MPFFVDTKSVIELNNFFICSPPHYRTIASEYKFKKKNRIILFDFGNRMDNDRRLSHGHFRK